MSVKIIDTLKPKNGGAFPIVEAVDIAVSSDLRLPEALEAKANASDLAATAAVVETKANASDVATATTELQGEIDQIVISASAEAVVAPEVAAARVSDYGASYQTLKNRLDAEWDLNQRTFGEIFDEQTENVDVSAINGAVHETKTSSRDASYYGTSCIILDQNNNHDTYYFVATAACDIYVDVPTSDYYAICHGASYTGIEENRILCSNPQRYRYRKNDQGVQENTLPTISNKLHVSVGDVVVFSFKLGDTVYINGVKTKIVSDRFKDDISSSVTPSVLENVIEGEAGVVYDTNSTYDSTFQGYAMTGGIAEDSNYMSYCLVIPKDTDLYVDFANDVYFSICVYDDQQYRNGVRYRKYDNEDTLPYENAPISLVAGQYIIFTVRPSKGDTRFSVVLTDLQQKYLKEDILLSQAQINQITSGNYTEKSFFRYVNAGGSDSSVGRLEIYTHAKTGYIEWDFLHCVSEQKNADIWRVGYAYKTDENFTKQFQITVGGEWEMAVHLPNRDDFSGGAIHGDEVLTDVLFLVDGAAVDVTESEEFIQFKEIVIVEASYVYDPAEESKLSDDEQSKVKIAKHGSKHVFTSSGLSISQTLEWLITTSITRCYMAMHLPSKSVTDHAVLDSDFVPFEITEYGNQYDNVKSAIIYGAESGIVTEFEVGEYPSGFDDSGKFLLTDNNGNAYNKCYFIIASSGSVDEGTLWKSETRYKFKTD